MKKSKSLNLRYFLLAICLTTSLMLIKKSNIFESLNNSINLRSLIAESKKNYICNKAGSKLTDKYQTDFNEEEVKRKKLSKAQQTIVDIAKDADYDANPLLRKYAIFIIIFLTGSIIIYLWISYCCCCCCNCCLFKPTKPSKCCSLVLYIIAAICCIVVIVFSIVILGVLDSFFARFNGLACSVLYFFDHVRYGLAPSYTNRQGEWEGVNLLADKLENTYERVVTIQKGSNELLSDIEDRESNYNEICSTEYQTLLTNANTMNSLITTAFSGIGSFEPVLDMVDVSVTFDDADDEFGNDIYKLLHNTLNKYVSKIIMVIYILTLVCGALGLTFLSLYFFLKTNVFRILYVVIWNISMLLLYISIIFGGLFGIIGHLFRDAVQIGQYVLSNENLNSTDPIIFEISDEYVSDFVETCVNGDGNFTYVIKDGDVLISKVDDFKKNQAAFQQARNGITCPGNQTKENELKGYYGELLTMINESLTLTYNLTYVSCSFARNDKNIILNELDTGGIKGIGLCASCLIVGYVLGLSVLMGILLVHRYRWDYEEKEKEKEETNKNVENETAFNINNPYNVTNYALNTQNNSMMNDPNNNTTASPNITPTDNKTN